MDIREADLSDPAIEALLAGHLREMRRVSPPGTGHVMAIDGLRAADVTVWAVLDGETPAGCGALKALGEAAGEIKSMHVAPAYRRRGVGALLLAYIIDAAKHRGYATLSLETGAYPAFDPARRLYARFGFGPCGAFGDYPDLPTSTFMVLKLDGQA